MSITVIEGVVLGLGAVGAICAGNAAFTVAKRNGCTDSECMASSAVATGLSAAVLPAAAVAGAFIIGVKAKNAWQDRKSIIANTKTKHAEAMERFRGSKVQSVA